MLEYAILRQNFDDMTSKYILEIFLKTSRELLERHREQIRRVVEKNAILIYTGGRGLFKETFTARTRRINAEECL